MARLPLYAAVALVTLPTLVGCGNTTIRIGTARPLTAGAETRLVQRQEAALPPLGAGPAIPTPSSPTPMDRAPGVSDPLPEAPAAAPPAAAPLPLAASLGQGQGEGLKAEPHPTAAVVPVSRTVPFSEALRVLADHHGIRLATSLSADPSVEIGATPGSDLVANVSSLLAAVIPPHFAAVSLNGDGLPTALIVAPHPIVGGFSK